MDLFGVESEPKSPNCGNNSATILIESQSDSDKENEGVINNSSPKRQASSPEKQWENEKKAKLDLVKNKKSSINFVYLIKLQIK